MYCSVDHYRPGSNHDQTFLAEFEVRVLTIILLIDVTTTDASPGNHIIGLTEDILLLCL